MCGSMSAVLLLGDADCVYEDAAAALAEFKFDFVAAVNNIGRTWPYDVAHWFTLHPAPCPDWMGIHRARQERMGKGLNHPTTWAHKPWPGVDRVVANCWLGSSGLFAVKCLIYEIGATAIVLAGIPMEGKHFYTDRDWKHATKYQPAWEKHLNEIAPYVRSMSGWTRGLLGAP
jgi:hypothetical protein